MGFGWEGKKTRLVPMDEARHFENCLRWINDPETTAWLGVADQPMSRLAEQEWFQRACKNDGSSFHFAIETLDGIHIGNSAIFNIDRLARTATSGSLIGEAEYRGKGYGADAARVRARFAFECQNLRLLYSGYLAGNEASARMQAAVGYVEWGRQPGAVWKRGDYWDLVHTVLGRNSLRDANLRREA